MLFKRQAGVATLVELLRLRAAEQPRRWSYSFLADGEVEEARLTYADLDLRARAIAVRIREAARPGERVLLLLPSDLEFVAAFFGCLYAGVVAVPAYPPRSHRSLDRLLTLAGDAGTRLALTTSALLARRRAWSAEAGVLGELDWRVTDDLTGEAAGELAAAWRDPSTAPDDLALLQYTSGSTAEPKGVMVRHRHLLHNQEAIRRAFAQSDRSVIVGWLPLFHDMGLIGNVLQPLYVDAPCVLMSPAAFLQRPRRWLRAISAYRATTSGGPNFAYDLCVSRIPPEQREGLDLASWTVAFNGAEPVRAETLERFAAAFAPCGFRRSAFYPCYGLAEATLFVAGGEAGRGATVGRFSAAALEQGRGEEDAGGGPDRPLVGCGGAGLDQRLAIVDPEQRRELPPGRVGEIWVSGPGVAAGYWNRPQESERCFAARLAGGRPEETFLRTGDLGFVAGGELYVTGRIKDLMILRGRNHYPQDFEATAEASHPDLRPGGVAAFSRTDEGEERLVVVAEVERRREAALDAAAAAAEVRRAIAEVHEVQAGEVVLIRAGTLPRTSSGKVRRRATRQAYLAGELTVVGRSRATAAGADDQAPAPAPAAPPRLAGMPPEERRAALLSWLAAAVGRACWVAPESVPAAAPLTAAGLDSLASITLGQAVEEAFGVALPVEELLDGATLDGLAERILEAAAAAETVTPERAAGPGATAEGAPVEGASFPLSFGQRALWFLDRLAPESAVYNLAAAARIEGDLDLPALEGAFADLAERHPALRTTFEAGDGLPRQRVRRRLAPDLRIEEAPEGEDVRSRLDREARRPFDLEAGPGWRCRLYLHAPRRATLLLVVHHLLADFWSLVVLLRDLETAYRRRRGEEPAADPAPPAATYADFVGWQERRLAGAEGERLRRFWEERITPPLPALDLPSDRPRPPAQSFRGASVARRLDPALTGELRRLARAHDATPFMALLALFQLLLHRASGQDEVLVGTPTSGRGAAGFAGVVGYFVNPVVVRSRLAPGRSFAGHLAGLRRDLLAAYAHQDYPFALLAERLQPERDPGRPPVFQAMFLLQQAQSPELERLAGFALGEGGARLTWAGCELESLRLGWRPAPFDLTLSLAESGGGLDASLLYSRDLFDATTAQRLLERFAVLAGAAAAAPERAADALPWLRAGERAQLVTEWNDTTLPPPAERRIDRQIERQALRTPERVALVSGGEALTYGELDRAGNRLAHHLLAAGLGAEGRVGVALERSNGMVVALLAVLKAGGAYVPLDPGYPRRRLALIVEDAGIDLVVTAARRAAAFAAGVRTVSPDAEAAAIAARPAAVPAPRRELPGGLAYLIYTSGSTGRPKGVMVEHRQVANFFAAMDRRLAGEPGRWLAATSISFDISVLELLWTLARGARVVVRETDPLPAAAAPSLARPVDFSLFYFASDAGAGDAGAGERGSARYRLLLEAAKRADALGFSAVWTPERHFHAFGGLYPNPSLTAAAVATVTERVAIRAGSVVLPLHSPVRVAEEWSVVDNLSDGRVGIAFASGWNAADFVFAPQRYADRKQAMLEGIDVVRRLWRGEGVRLPGGAGEVEVKIFPRPVQPELPVWLTAAGSPDTFRLAAELGANVLTHLLGQSIEDVGEKIAAYRDAWRRAGHPGEGRVSLMLHTFVGEDVDEVRRTVREPLTRYLASSLDLMKVLAPGQDLTGLDEADREVLLAGAFDRYFETSGLFGTPESCLERLGRLAEIGVDEVACLIDFGVPTDVVLASLEPLAALAEAGRRAAERGTEAEPETLAEQIERHAVDHFQATPSVIGALLLDPRAGAALAGLRRLLAGGEELPPALAGRAVQDPGELLNMYGPTETTIWSAVGRIDADGAVTLGRPIANTRIDVVDGCGEAVPVGQPGELLIGGDGVVRGYWRRPGLTAERFVPDPFSGRPGTRLYRTGDRVRRLPDGRLAFLGRIDHQVKVRGHRIELGEIESALAQHPAVREAVVVARREAPGDLAGARLVAYLVPAAPGTTPPDRPRRERALAGHRRHQLPNGLEVAHLGAEQTSALYREIFEQEIYLRHDVALPPGACVFDVGANVGLFTLFARDRCPDAAIYAFEPIPPTFEVLRANAGLYGGGARVFPLGLSDREEEAELTFYPRMAGLSGRFSEDDEELTRSIIRTWLAEQQGSGAELSDDEVAEAVAELLRSERHRCRLRPLSALVAELGVERIDLLKIDVEKSELRVLQGVADEDWPKIGQIVIEVHTRELLDACSELLAKRGYELAVDEFIATDEVGGFVWMLYAARRDWRPAPAGETAAAAPALAIPELRRALEGRLPAYLVPSAFVALDALPLTPNGKVDRRALPAPEAVTGSGAAAARREPPRTETERLVAAVWQELLPVAEVGRRDNFFELGGNSLLLVEAHGRLRRALGREVPLRTLLRGQTVEALAASIEALGEGEDAAGALLPRLRALPRNGPVPLSFAQERLWFLHRLSPSGSMLNVAYGFRLRGELHPAALAAALTALGRRHQVLCSRILESDGVPRQEVPAAAPLPLPAVDLGRLAEAAAVLQRLADAEAGRPFDLASGPLLRALLLRRDAADHVLVLNLHHLAVDAWSLEIFFNELAELYRSAREARPPRLAELPLQYADFARWQRSADGEAHAADLAFWRRQLATVPPAPLLPGQRRRPPAPRFRGAVHRFELAPQVSAALGELARGESATVFMTLFAAFSALLHQYSGQEELLIGTNVANRGLEETRGLIGYFVNNLALRADLSGDPTFRQLLGRVRETALAAFAHQEVPFERVMAAVQPRRDGGYAPLFRVMFVMQNVLPWVWQLPGVETAPFELGQHLANFDLTVLMAEGRERLEGAFLFDVDLFDSAAVARMADHFTGLLASVAADPDQAVAALDLGLDAAARALADEFSQGASW